MNAHRGRNVEGARYALAHDTVEACLLDVPGSMKQALPGTNTPSDA